MSAHFIAVLAVVGSIASIIGLVSLFKNSSTTKIKQKHSGIGDNIAGDKIINRKPYTGTQTLNMLPPHLGGNGELDLDGMGKMHITEWTPDSLTLMLPALPSSSVEGMLEEDTEIGSDEQGIKATFYKHPFMRVSNPSVTYSAGANMVTLSRKNPRVAISVSGRTFELKLIKIKKIQKPLENVSEELRTAYEVAINETTA